MREIPWQRSEGPSELRTSPVPAGVLAGAVQVHSSSAERAESLPSFRGHSAPENLPRGTICVSATGMAGLGLWSVDLDCSTLRGLHLSPGSEKSAHSVEERWSARRRKGAATADESMALGEVRGGTEPAGCVAGKGESELTSPRARRPHEVLCQRAADT